MRLISRCWQGRMFSKSHFKWWTFTQFIVVYWGTLDKWCCGNYAHASSKAQVCEEWKAGNCLWWTSNPSQLPFFFSVNRYWCRDHWNSISSPWYFHCCWYQVDWGIRCLVERYTIDCPERSIRELRSSCSASR